MSHCRFAEDYINRMPRKMLGNMNFYTVAVTMLWLS